MRPRISDSPKKRAVVLFEILLGLTLTAILITFLFSFFVESAKIETKLDTARVAITARGMVQTRLQSILCSIDRSSPLVSSFYTKTFEKEKKPSLIVMFDNGVDPEPLFSGPIIGRLWIDEKRNLVLTTWPLNHEESASWRTEVLLTEVETYEFQFFGRKESMKEEYTWQNAWPQSKMEIPSMIRLTIKEKSKKDPLRFAFHLPTPIPLITFKEAT